jgi:hypothetical protein
MASGPWSNQPLALTEFGGVISWRKKVDLSDATEARLVVPVGIAGTGAAKLYAQYSTDLASWNYLDGGTGPSASIGTTGVKVSSWFNLPSGAKSDVYLRLVADGGDGNVDLGFGVIEIQVR